MAFRQSLILGEVYNFSCLTGTMAEEMHAASPAIRDAEALGAEQSTATAALTFFRSTIPLEAGHTASVVLVSKLASI